MRCTEMYESAGTLQVQGKELDHGRFRVNHYIYITRLGVWLTQPLATRNEVSYVNRLSNNHAPIIYYRLKGCSEYP